MSIQIKICGITTLDAADAAAQAGVDFMGMVFFQKSPRNVEFDQANAISARVRGGPRLVAVFVNADDSTISEAVASAQPDYLQLHGTETPARTAQIASRFGLPLIKALPVAESSDLACVNAYTEIVDYLLFDAKAPKAADRPGGHGVPFDWKLLAGIDIQIPWLLSGGVTSENVERAIRTSGAKIVDISSGVEIAPGIKSPEKIKEFVAAARRSSSAEPA